MLSVDLTSSNSIEDAVLGYLLPLTYSHILIRLASLKPASVYRVTFVAS